MLVMNRSRTSFLRISLILILPVAAMFLFGCSDEDPVSHNAAPTVELVVVPQDTVAAGEDCRFSWQGSDADGSVEGYYYDLDDDSPETWTTSDACTLSNVAIGDHTFYIQAKDDDGALSKLDSASFSVIGSPTGCDVWPNSLNFGSVQTGDSVEQDFTITNNGTTQIDGSVTESTPSRHYQIVSGSGSYSIPAGASHTVTVRFVPKTDSTHDCTVDLGSNLCTGVACTGEGSGTYGSTVLAHNVISADIQPWVLVSIDVDIYTYSLFDDFSDIEVGDIIISAGGSDGGLTVEGGYLRKITRIIRRTASELEIETAAASLVDCFQQCDIDQTVSVPLGIPGVDGYVMPGLEITDSSLVIEDYLLVDINVGLVDVYAKLDRAEVVVTDPTLDFSLHVQDGSIAEFRTLYESRTRFEMDFSLSVSPALAIDWEYDLPPIELYRKTDCDTTYAPIDIYKRVPIVHEVTTTATLEGVEFSLSGEIDAEITDLGTEVTVQVGARYDGSTWHDLNDIDYVNSEPGVNVSACFAKGSIKPILKVEIEEKFYGYPAPTVTVRPSVEGSITGDCSSVPPTWCVGVQSAADVESVFLGLDFLDPSLTLPGFPALELFGDPYEECWPKPIGNR